MLNQQIDIFLLCNWVISVLFVFDCLPENVAIILEAIKMLQDVDNVDKYIHIYKYKQNC